MKHRWPKSLHSEIEAIFHSIVAFRQGKSENQDGLRSSRTWNLYRYETHRFGDFLLARGIKNLLDTKFVHDAMGEFLKEKLAFCVQKQQSKQTFETILAALGKFQYALNHYIDLYKLEAVPLDVESIRMDFYSQSKRLLPRSSRKYDNRAYPDPVSMIESISNGTHQLQALLQLEGGLRAEGVGSPGHKRFKNPLTGKCLQGIGPDPVSGLPVGRVASVEKGGKQTTHYISCETYRHLESYIQTYGKLEGDYSVYIDVINKAAKKTKQYIAGRGSHGLKHNFAQRRNLECVSHGMTHEAALQQTSLETSHFRMSETLTYTRGPK
jgi:hypothetical protein